MKTSYSREEVQRLIDATYQIAILSAETGQNRSIQQITAWVSLQLDACGFPTTPCGKVFVGLT